jgi:hypothetical protein
VEVTLHALHTSALDMREKFNAPAVLPQEPIGWEAK